MVVVARVRWRRRAERCRAGWRGRRTCSLQPVRVLVRVRLRTLGNRSIEKSIKEPDRAEWVPTGRLTAAAACLPPPRALLAFDGDDVRSRCPHGSLIRGPDNHKRRDRRQRRRLYGDWSPARVMALGDHTYMGGHTPPKDHTGTCSSIEGTCLLHRGWAAVIDT